MSTLDSNMKIRVDAVDALVASLRDLKDPSTKLHNELARTRYRIRVWRRQLMQRIERQ
jgi:hypothetical protein